MASFPQSKCNKILFFQLYPCQFSSFLKPSEEKEKQETWKNIFKLQKLFFVCGVMCFPFNGGEVPPPSSYAAVSGHHHHHSFLVLRKYQVSKCERRWLKRLHVCFCVYVCVCKASEWEKSVDEGYIYKGERWDFWTFFFWLVF